MTNSKRIEQMLLDTLPKSFQENVWGKRHCQAWVKPNSYETAIVALVAACAVYADNYHQRYEQRIGADGVMGRYWQEIVEGTRGLLNGECDRLDCGTVDKLLNDMLEAEGLGER